MPQISGGRFGPLIDVPGQIEPFNPVPAKKPGFKQTFLELLPLLIGGGVGAAFGGGEGALAGLGGAGRGIQQEQARQDELNERERERLFKQKQQILEQRAREQLQRTIGRQQEEQIVSRGGQ